jgi:hypothetical protein
MSLNLVLASSMSINLIGGGLVLIGLALLISTLLFWRAAVEDPEVLAPLEIMADRKFARADETRRLAMLNQMRPEGAEPVVHHAASTMLMREPVSEPLRPFEDKFGHDDDAVDVVIPSVIDPLLSKHTNKE